MNDSTSDILGTDSIKAVVTREDVENILSVDYGLLCPSIKDLNGYDDINFYVKPEKLADNCSVNKLCDDGYVLKVINSLDSKDIDFFDAQDCVLVYLGNRGVCCPKPVKNLKDKYWYLKQLKTGNHIVRLLEFVPGSILSQVECIPTLCFECGAFIANLNETLKNFTHKGYEDRNTAWMLKNVPNLSTFLFAVNDTRKQQLVSEIIDAFSSRVLSISDQFEKGLIHGDFNEQNILVEERDGTWHLKGVLDFGDSHIACILYDLAITMTYIIIESKDISRGGYVIAGYNSVRPLSTEEAKLLKICICARFCQSLVLGAFTYSRDPGNTYVMRTAKVGWSILEQLWKMTDEEVMNQWMSVSENFVAT